MLEQNRIKFMPFDESNLSRGHTNDDVFAFESVCVCVCVSFEMYDPSEGGCQHRTYFEIEQQRNNILHRSC